MCDRLTAVIVIDKGLEALLDDRRAVDNRSPPVNAGRRKRRLLGTQTGPTRSWLTLSFLVLLWGTGERTHTNPIHHRDTEVVKEGAYHVEQNLLNGFREHLYSSSALVFPKLSVFLYFDSFACLLEVFQSNSTTSEYVTRKVLVNKDNCRLKEV